MEVLTETTRENRNSDPDLSRDYNIMIARRRKHARRRLETKINLALWAILYAVFFMLVGAGLALKLAGIV